jgi:hypothetical protein
MTLSKVSAWPSVPLALLTHFDAIALQARHADELAQLRRLHLQDERIPAGSGSSRNLVAPSSSGTIVCRGNLADPDPGLSYVIPLPPAGVVVPMEEIRQGCGYEGQEYDFDWNALNVRIHSVSRAKDLTCGPTDVDSEDDAACCARLGPFLETAGRHAARPAVRFGTSCHAIRL